MSRYEVLFRTITHKVKSKRFGGVDDVLDFIDKYETIQVNILAGEYPDYIGEPESYTSEHFVERMKKSNNASLV